MSKRKTISICCAPMKRQYETNTPRGRVVVEEIVYIHGVVEHRGRRWFRGAIVK